MAVLADHDRPVASVRWVEPPGGGLLLATGDDDGIVRLWDADTWQCSRVLVAGDDYQGRPSGIPLLRRFRRPPARLKRIRSVAWIADRPGASLLVTASYDQTVRVWDAGSWRCRRVLTGHSLYVTAVAGARTNDGQVLLASGAYDHTVRIWDVDSGECRQVLRCDASVISLAWATRPDGTLLLAAGADHGTVRIWDAQTWECRHVLRDELDGTHPTDVVVQASSLDWIASPGAGAGMLLAGANLLGNRVHVWDGERGTLRRVVDPIRALERPANFSSNYVIAVAWADSTERDGVLRLAIGGGPDLRLSVWDVPLDRLAADA
ncbi:WD40 repeat domain-containing protein [Plantactinospora endophytica]|uniref:hypothetical protein n=1 Tax=Plantactinospora endophytica TaxID=673535 RepID=UPI001EF3B8F1|nr:hypothetical protein [Plantactinospora endophytica]